jgi:hypothetical protein
MLAVICFAQTWNSGLSLCHAPPRGDADAPVALVVLDDHPSPAVIVLHHLEHKYCCINKIEIDTFFFSTRLKNNEAFDRIF